MADSVKRSRGDTISQIELHQRWNLVEDLLVAGLPQHRVVDEGVKRWQVSTRTVFRYISSVRDRWIQERELDRPGVVESRLARLRMMASKCERKEAFSAAARYDEMINEILGVKAPEQHEHKVAAIVAHVGPQSLDVLDEASESFIEELERLMQVRRSGAHVNVIGDASTVPDGSSE